MLDPEVKYQMIKFRIATVKLWANSTHNLALNSISIDVDLSSANCCRLLVAKPWTGGPDVILRDYPFW